nr:FAD-dependent oxidoreductase [Nakamurella panacisegetis]
MSRPRGDVVIVGGGVIGLACAFRLSEAGAEITVVDPGGAAGASWAAAGMLAPLSEAGFGEQDLVELNVAAVAEFRVLAEALDELPGESVGLRTEGTLAVAFNTGDKAALARMSAYRNSLGWATQTLTGSATRKLEPFLAAGVNGGVLAGGDLSVDNRRYLRSLQRATAARGVRMVTGTVSRLDRTGGRVSGVTTDSGEQLPAATVVLCAGAQSGRLSGYPIHPVKGQILRLQIPPRLLAAGPVLTHTLRALVRARRSIWCPGQGARWCSAPPRSSRVSTPWSPPAVCSSCCATHTSSCRSPRNSRWRRCGPVCGPARPTTGRCSGRPNRA